MSRHDVSDTAHNFALLLMLGTFTFIVCYAFYTFSNLS